MWQRRKTLWSGSATAQLDRFEALAQECAPVVYRYVRSWTGSEAEAEDLTQDALLKAFERRDQLQDVDRFLPWVLTIARHTVLNNYRRPHRRREVPLEWDGPAGDGDAGWALPLAEEGPDARDRLARQDMAALIEEALQELDEPSREMFLMRYYGDAKTGEIAKALGVPIGTVTAKLCRGARLLRTKLERLGIREEDVAID